MDELKKIINEINKKAEFNSEKVGKLEGIACGIISTIKDTGNTYQNCIFLFDMYKEGEYMKITVMKEEDNEPEFIFSVRGHTDKSDYIMPDKMKKVFIQKFVNDYSNEFNRDDLKTKKKMSSKITNLFKRKKEEKNIQDTSFVLNL